MKINISDTWSSSLPVLLEVASNGTSKKGREEAKEKLLTMANLADEHMNFKKDIEKDLLNLCKLITESHRDNPKIWEKTQIYYAVLDGARRIYKNMNLDKLQDNGN